MDPDRPPPAPSRASRDSRARGFVAALAAYLSWGIFPVYFKAVRQVPPLEILAHRAFWSAVFLAGVVTVRRRWREVGAALTGRQLGVYVVTTLLVSGNWLLFIWAVNTGRVLEASLGYFVNPLVNVLLGAIFLRERLGRRQLAAVALAGAGVLALVLRLGAFPWVSLGLAATFSLYALVRKKAHIDALVGLLVETALLAPVAAGYVALLAARRQGSFGVEPRTTALLVVAGVVTAVPLIWFALGIRVLRLSTMGLIQYVTPTCQFLLAVALYRERFTAWHGLAFGCIWISLAIYSHDALRGHRPAAPETVALD